MKTNTKRKLSMLEDHQLKKRYHYLKSKNTKEGDSIQMRYIKYHLRKRGLSAN